MSASILEWALIAAQALIATAMACAAFRLLAGPRAQDRVLALDTLYVNAMLLILAFGMRTGETLYFEAALVIGMLGFVSTSALARLRSCHRARSLPISSIGKPRSRARRMNRRVCTSLSS